MIYTITLITTKGNNMALQLDLTKLNRALLTTHQKLDNIAKEVAQGFKLIDTQDIQKEISLFKDMLTKIPNNEKGKLFDECKVLVTDAETQLGKIQTLMDRIQKKPTTPVAQTQDKPFIKIVHSPNENQFLDFKKNKASNPAENSNVQMEKKLSPPKATVIPEENPINETDRIKQDLESLLTCKDVPNFDFLFSVLSDSTKLLILTETLNAIGITGTDITNELFDVGMGVFCAPEDGALTLGQRDLIIENITKILKLQSINQLLSISRPTNPVISQNVPKQILPHKFDLEKVKTAYQLMLGAENLIALTTIESELVQNESDPFFYQLGLICNTDKDKTSEDAIARVGMRAYLNNNVTLEQCKDALEKALVDLKEPTF